jgi:probable HAF family extracellular repeat protein
MQVSHQRLLWTAAQGWHNFGAGAIGVYTAVSEDGRVGVGLHGSGETGTPLSAVRFHDGQEEILFETGHDGAFFGVSADGTVAVGHHDFQAARWTPAAGFQPLGHIPGFAAATGAASGVSRDGSAIAGSDGAYDGRSQAFRWTAAEGVRGLGHLPGAPAASRTSFASGISADGTTVVGASTNSAGVLQGFVWKQHTGMVPLPLLAPFFDMGLASAVSEDGSVIVGTAVSQSAMAAYYWDRARGRRSLQQFLISLGATGLDGWALAEAKAVSPDGAHIVGYGRDPQGNVQAWLAHIPPFCYSNCDGSTAPPILNVNDFTCYLNRFAATDPYANCDNSTAPPTLNVADFICFMNKYAAGCT